MQFQALKLLVFAASYAALNVAGASLIKSYLQQNPIQTLADYIPTLFNLRVIIGFGLIFTSALVLFKALSEYEFSLMIPIATGINFLLTLLVGYLLFSERLSLLTYFGVAVILAGIILMALGQRA